MKNIKRATRLAFQLAVLAAVLTTGIAWAGTVLIYGPVALQAFVQ